MKRLSPGDYICSPGLQFEYEILSFPVCRLYYDPTAKFQFQPNKMEAGERGCQKYLSYLVRLNREAGEHIIGEPFYLTFRKGYKYGRYETFTTEDGVYPPQRRDLSVHAELVT